MAAFAGAVFSFVGLIHGPHLGWMVSPLVALVVGVAGRWAPIPERGISLMSFPFCSP